MPVYQYKCPACGRVYSFTLSIREYTEDGWDHANTFCGECPVPRALRRVYTAPTVVLGFEAGYNHALGQYVGTEQQLDRAFKEASEAATLRTGLEHRFVPHDAADPDVKSALGVTDEGLDATYRHRRESGLTDRSTFG